MSSLPIADYALLSDCRSAALVSRAGSLDWLCWPRFDSASCFARLLDDRAGHWSIRPAGESKATRRYLDQTLVLETTFVTPGGRAVLVDALAVGPNKRGHQLGAESPRIVLRQVSCLEGSVEMELEYAPRPEYGLVEPLLVRTKDGVAARGGPDVLFLSSAEELAVDGAAARGRFRLAAGQSAAFALHHRSTWEAPPGALSQQEIAGSLSDTVEAWRSWSREHQRYQGPWPALVHQSGRVLYALSYFPTGAIVAAPTTSLPEVVGGARNWDYRFTWVRDASLTLEALWVAACPDEGISFFNFLAGAALTQLRGGVDLQIMFGIGGEHDLAERELGHLAGWRGSRPVRIGNGAFSQRQLDVYGELLGAAHRLKELLGGLDLSTREFLAGAVDAAASRWKEKDQGIWEVRGPPRHFVYSKLMCWVALDRGIALAKDLDALDRVQRWEKERDQIRRAILERGFSEQAGAFTQSFGSEDLDASNLMMPIVGFLPATDGRMLSTIHAVAERLTDQHGLVYRYRSQDGLPGKEGTFLLCTFWLAQAQALAGELGRAKETFARAAAFANDVGLLSEEADPSTGELLGNFPQAFSHIGLVNAAWAIAQAEGAPPPGR